MGTSSPCPSEAQVMTRVPRLGEDEVRTRFTRSKRPKRGPVSPGTGEAQVATKLTRSRRGHTSRHAEEPCPDDVHVGTRVTRSR